MPITFTAPSVSCASSRFFAGSLTATGSAHTYSALAAELGNRHNDPDYQPYLKARQAGSVSQFCMIDDTDIAGTVPYLKAA